MKPKSCNDESRKLPEFLNKLCAKKLAYEWKPDVGPCVFPPQWPFLSCCVQDWESAVAKQCDHSQPARFQPLIQDIGHTVKRPHHLCLQANSFQTDACKQMIATPFLSRSLKVSLLENKITRRNAQSDVLRCDGAPASQNCGTWWWHFLYMQFENCWFCTFFSIHPTFYLKTRNLKKKKIKLVGTQSKSPKVLPVQLTVFEKLDWGVDETKSNSVAVMENTVEVVTAAMAAIWPLFLFWRRALLVSRWVWLCSEGIHVCGWVEQLRCAGWVRQNCVPLGCLMTVLHQLHSNKQSSV